MTAFEYQAARVGSWFRALFAPRPISITVNITVTGAPEASRIAREVADEVTTAARRFPS